MAATLLTLGELALEQGDANEAVDLLEQARTLNQELGDVPAAAYALSALGFAELRADKCKEAGAIFCEALDVLDDDASPDVLFRALDGAGIVAARQGDGASAARIWGAAEAVRAAHDLRYRHIERERHEDEVSRTRWSVDEASFADSWQQGRSSPIAEIRTLARRACSDVPTPPDMRDPAPDPGVPAVRMRPAAKSAQNAPPHAALRLQGLGVVGVFQDWREVSASEFTYAKAKELLFFLLGHPAATKEQIGLALWPDATPDYLRVTFRAVVYHLRHALGTQTWIVRQQRYYAFDRTQNYWYDVEAFEAAIQLARRKRAVSLAEAQTALEAAISLYRGDYWEGLVVSEWIAKEQARLQHLHLQALLALGDLYACDGEVHLALERFLRAVERDPYCEEAHRGVIRCYMHLHEPSQAIRHFEHLALLLNEQLGARPSDETAALVARVHEG
jgi:DNA-binding SARP family transcriptional activator